MLSIARSVNPPSSATMVQANGPAPRFSCLRRRHKEKVTAPTVSNGTETGASTRNPFTSTSVAEACVTVPDEDDEDVEIDAER